jgi:hypothetical protein
MIDGQRGNGGHPIYRGERGRLSQLQIAPAPAVGIALCLLAIQFGPVNIAAWWVPSKIIGHLRSLWGINIGAGCQMSQSHNVIIVMAKIDTFTNCQISVLEVQIKKWVMNILIF